MHEYKAQLWICPPRPSWLLIFHQYHVAKTMSVSQHKVVAVEQLVSTFKTLPDKGIYPHISSFPAPCEGSELINLETWRTFPFIAQRGTPHWGFTARELNDSATIRRNLILSNSMIHFTSDQIVFMPVMGILSTSVSPGLCLAFFLCTVHCYVYITEAYVCSD